MILKDKYCPLFYRLCCLLCLAPTTSVTLRGEFCRTAEFTVKPDTKLVGHVVETLSVTGSVDCLVRCNEHSQCKSVNFEETSDSLESRLCELNGKNEKMAGSEYLIHRPSFTYYESFYTKDVIDCSKSPCLNGGSCVDGNGGCVNKNSFCKCLRVYEGTHCETFRPKTCRDIKLGDPMASDGEFELFLKLPDCGQSARIYCAAMNSSSPLEYVSLPAGKDINIAIHYNPKAGNRREETQFEKIRLDVATMAIDRSDYKFAFSNVIGVYHSYASAYDCISPSCDSTLRQGEFKVDISGTSFRLPESIPYSFASYPLCVQKLFYPSMSSDRVRWFAKCGGHCGHCWPSILLLEIKGC